MGWCVRWGVVCKMRASYVRWARLHTQRKACICMDERMGRVGHFGGVCPLSSKHGESVRLV